MARTRAKSDYEAAPTMPTTPVTSSKFPPSTNPGSTQRVLILPRRATPEARIVLLPNPRHGRPARYLMCPETGLYEFITMAPPKPSTTSWLIETRIDVSDTDSGSRSTNTAEARIVVDSNLYMATAIDPLFLILPALVVCEASPKESNGKKSLFRSSDDYLDELPGDLSHLPEILRWPGTKTLFQGRMAAVCDSVEAGDETMFRLNEEKLAKVILSKAMMLSDGGLPPSMEQRFVTSVLEAPFPMSKQTADPERPPPQSDLTDSSAVASDTATAFPSELAATNSSRAEEEQASEALANTSEPPLHTIHLQRLRVAFDFICSNYISPSLTERLSTLLTCSGLVDFSPLDDYLLSATQLPVEAVHLGLLSNLSRKRADNDDDEARAAKKRKLEEEKRQKATESRGVRQLKKVDTTGMKKLSTFKKN